MDVSKHASEKAVETTEHLVRQVAALKIARCWRSHRRREMFKQLRQHLLSSEKLLTTEVLKRVSPREAELLRDPVIGGRVRFRLGGYSFPPTIFYKISTSKSRVCYLSGKTMITPHSQAAIDARKIKGPSRYAQDVIEDIQDQLKFAISSITDVTNSFEYIQHNNFVEERPAHAGGKNNGWRELKIAFSLQPVQDHLINWRQITEAKNQQPRSRLSHRPRPQHPTTQKRLRDMKQRMLIYDAHYNATHRSLSSPVTTKHGAISHSAFGEEEEEDEFSRLYAWSSELRDPIDED